MNVVDVIIIVFALALAVLGYERGLISSGLPLIGFVVGALIGGRLGPALLPGGGESTYAPLITVLAALLLGAVFALALEGVGEVVRVQHLPPGGLAARADGVGGAILMAGLALLVAWAFAAAALNAPGPGERDLRNALQRSQILSALNGVLPPTGPLFNLLRHIDPVPSISGPEADVGPPQHGIGRDPDVRRAGASVVKVLGSACGLSIEGSGWVSGPDLVVTNAHVVAGEDDTTVTTPAGATLDATAVHYDSHNDLAILRVPGLGLAPLHLAPQVSKGTPAAVLGYPENGPFTITPARIGATGKVISQDSYGRGPVEREMTPFRGSVRSGNSGGPAVDGGGRVLTTVFASAQGRGPAGGLGIPDEIIATALGGSLRPTSTGPCAA
jgi:Trypsin-like peptidase domain/Colicin V production protein